jgi:hypothetical protein
MVSVLFEVLYFAFVLSGLFECSEGAKVAAFSRVWVLFSRVQAELSGFEFANHLEYAMQPGAAAWPEQISPNWNDGFLLKIRGGFRLNGIRALMRDLEGLLNQDYVSLNRRRLCG